MRPRFAHPEVRRTWTVELRPQPGGPVLVCQHCAHSGRLLNGLSARAELLAHLALHARRAPLPTHLRTCQCHERGCCWHRRHRGCQGPIGLLLARERGGRIWRLSDTCRACAAATDEAAVIPETNLTVEVSASERKTANRRRRRPKGPDSQTRVREMLSYLASALPPDTGAASRLIALQCALRMSVAGQVRLPLGLLRSLRLGNATDPFHELAQARWLRTVPTVPHVVAVQLLDPGLFTHHPARPDRLRAADWALRRACCIRTDSAPLPRLVALCLAARCAPGDVQGTAEPEQVARECGIPPSSLLAVLDQLIGEEILRSWSAGQPFDDLCWMLMQPLRSPNIGWAKKEP